MLGLKLAGGLWLFAGLNSAGMVFGVWDEPPLLALALFGTVTGLVVGGLLVTRPGPDAVRLSNLAGLAWLIAFGALTVVEIVTEMRYVSFVASLTALGVAAALVAFWRRPAVMSA